MNFVEYLLTLQIQMTYLMLENARPVTKANADELLNDMYEQIKLKDSHELEQDGEMEISSKDLPQDKNSIKDRLFKL